ncbi:cupin domain-containing protein [Chitinophaga deserti]|uniref:cupin domain-containing protein n=1 Tax=Chitinophaga deserti TaxID=2164099 RepID=UPI000D6DB8C6|nr:cupin domain-containing protein [Chitinophaga deserti]
MEPVQTNGFRRYQGGYFRALITPEQTQNAMALIEFTLPRGAEPPLHVHQNEDEAFYLVEGRMSVRVGDKTTIMEAGDALFAPRNTPHAFQILTDSATLLNLITPGTLAGFFFEFSTPLTGVPAICNKPQEPDMEAVARMVQTITKTYQVQFLETK